MDNLPKKKILIVDDDPVIRKLVSSVLINAGYHIATADQGKEGLAQAINFQPDLIISDVLMPEMDGYEFVTRVQKSLGKKVPIVLLTALDSVEQKIKGFEVGADDYLVKPIEPNEFLARVGVLIRRSTELSKTETKAKTAKTIGVYSLRGGSGVSSVAVNLAVSLSQLWMKPTALVDLVITGGQSALFLNQPLKHTWADVTRFPLEEIDDYAVKSALLPHKSGISTLASPRRPEHGDQVTTEKVNKVLGILRSMQDYLVLDLAHDFSEITLAGLDHADVILVLFQPEVVSIRSAAMVLETFRELGYPEDKVRLLLNCTFPKKGIPLEDIQRYLKRNVNIVLPYLADKTIEAINTGIPLVSSNPEETLGVIFEDLALALSKDSHRKDYPENPTEALIRTTKRYQKRKKTN